ncbi:DMT family transporter [Maritalea sp.]|uniref:DMT family transporter n=1 Tax=Maritalea sp. TaxID=2003361 RepID=UPI003EF76B81
MSKQTNLSWPLILAFAAMLGFAVTDAMIKFIGQSLPIPQVASLRTIGGAILLLIALLSTQPFPLPKIDWKQHIGRGFLIALVTLCFYFSLAHFDFVTVAAVALFGQAVSSAIGVVFFNEKFSLRLGFALGLGVAGALCFLIDLNLFGQQIEMFDIWILPLAAIPFLEAFILALVKVQTRKEPVLITSTIQALLVALILAPGLALGYQAPTTMEWSIIAAMCVVGAATSYISIVALKDLPVSVFAITDNTSLLWAGIIGFLVFAESPSAVQVLGGILIVSCCFMLAKEVSAD